MERPDLGKRLQAILALGSQDIRDAADLVPMREGVRVIGCSSDHTVLDVEDCGGGLKIGDTVSFRLRYAAMLQAFSTRHVEIISEG